MRPAARRLKLPRALALACALVVLAGTLAAQSQATYLHTLASFDGPIRLDAVRVSVDQQTDETYLIYQNLIRIFNSSGMEVFSFGQDLDLGQILDSAVDQNGDILLLSYKDDRSVVTRCNYRGVPIGPIEFRGFPQGLVLRANRMQLRGGLLYLASLASASVVVATPNGEFKSQVEFLPLMGPEERQEGAEAAGFAVDGEGNMFITVPVLFRVFKRSPDGKLTSFGRAGAAPGRFGTVAGVESDSRGNLIVADKLKCTVMIFDKAFNFITEFGYRGSGPANLIVPEDVATDRHGRIYVSQWGRRGVSVFSFSQR